MLNDNIDIYTEYYNKASFKTIYHDPNFLLAEEKAEENNTYLYIYDKRDWFVILPGVKRKVNDVIDICQGGETYYDLRTPHEYSGVVADVYNSEHISKFYLELCRFCKQNHIIFSFIRFNPYSDERFDATNYVVQKSDEQIWIDCVQKDITDQFSKSLKRNYKCALKHGLICTEVVKDALNINLFAGLYRKAMDRLSASKFFYFNQQYFECLLKADFTKLYFVYDENKKNVLSAAVVLLDAFNKRAYYHLSCRRGGENISGVMEILVVTFSQELKKEGYRCIHLGGGATSSLREFKARFSEQRIDYFTGHQIFDKERYQRICDIFCQKNPEMADSQFLPLYRSRENIANILKENTGGGIMNLSE